MADHLAEKLDPPRLIESGRAWSEPWAAVAEGYEEGGLRGGETLDAALCAAMEEPLTDVESGWIEPQEVGVEIYERPVYCREAQDGRCVCRGDHADADPLLWWASRRSVKVMITLPEGGHTAEWEVSDG